MPLDLDQLARLYEARAADLLSFFARRTLQAEVSIDLVAETFAEQFRGASDDEAVGWIFGIARHELSAYFRRGIVARRAMAELGLAVPALTNADYERVEELVDLRAQRTVVARALAELSREHREALRLRIVEELSYSEVAQTLGTTEETARARVSRGLRALSQSTTELERSTEHA
jgi:RNA polymerase sigma-70 factor (ECF subfamily)